MNRIRFSTYLFSIILCCLAASSSWAMDFMNIAVVKGDTLKSLCQKYLEDQAKCIHVARMNRLRNPDIILPGQGLSIPVELLKADPVKGIVKYLKGTVFHTGQPGAAPQALTLNDNLKEGSHILTGKKSVVDVIYEDGTGFFVRPESSVDLVRTRRHGEAHYMRDLFLQTGEIINNIKRATGQEQRYNIQTPSATVGARGTEFRVAVDPAETTRSEVLEGVVSLAAMQQEVSVRKGEGSLVRKGEPPLPPRKLLAPPEPVHLKGVYTSDPIQIRFFPVDKAVAFRVMLARDPAMKDILQESVIAPGDFFISSGLSDGTYYLQALSIDDLGFVGIPVAPVPLTVKISASTLGIKPLTSGNNPLTEGRRLLPPVIQSPPANALLRERDVTFQWLQVEHAAGYRLQTAWNKEFTEVVTDVRSSGELQQTVREIAFGPGFFRIASVAADGSEGAWSEIHSFTIMPPPPTPDLAKPETGKEMVSIRARDAGAGMRYRFQVARDDSFTELLLDVTQNRPELELHQPSEPGLYRVRSKCIDASGYEGTFSPTQYFEIEREFPYTKVVVGLGLLGIILGMIF